jgi:hypothetical protein
LVIGSPPPSRESVNLEIPFLTADRALELAEQLRQAAHLEQSRAASALAAS